MKLLNLNSKLFRVVAAIAMLVMVSPALAQSLTGTVSGVVKDEQGGVLPGATITLLGKTGAITTVAAADGSYRFLAVEPGTYSISATMSGFEGRRQGGVVVNIGRTTPMDFSLKVSSLSETVDVSGEAPVVDVTSSATSNSLSQDLLFSMPIRPTNAATGLMNFMPGINSQSAFGGDGSTGNSLLLDGVDTRDPGFGSAWTFFNFNIVEEVQIGGLGAAAEYGGFTGGVVNTVTKSGGNKHGGLFELQFTNASLGSANVTDAVRKANPALGDPAKVTKLLDMTGQLSGPFIKDKLFYFASAQRYQLESDPSGPLTYRKEVSPRLNGKLTYIKDAKNNFNLTLQADDYNIKGRCDVAAYLCADNLLDDEDAPEIVWGASWRHVFSANTLAEVKYSGWWGYFDLNPVVNKPGRTDGDTGSRTVSLGWFSYSDRKRNQANASITHFADGFGKHELKFGVEIERSNARDRYGYINDIFYYDYGGSPYYAYNYGYDISGTNQRLAGFVQDSWKVNDRLTLNPGVRIDVYRGKGKDVGTVYSASGIAPRFGFAFDLTGDNKTVLKGSYGQYYEGLFTPIFAGALPGKEDFVLYDVSRCPSITANCAPFRQEIERTPATLYKVDPDIKHPRTQEFTVGFERALTANLRFSATGISRELQNVQGSVIPSARFAPVNVNNGLTGTPLTVYRWTNRSASEKDLLITNPDGFQYRDASGAVIATAAADRSYKAAMFVLNKRMSNNWLAQVSYVWSRTEGHLSNGSLASAGTSRFFETPTLSVVNTDGRALNDRTHELKVLAGYQIPKADVMVSAFYRNVSGRTYAPFAQLSSTEAPGYPSSTWRRPFLAPRGSYRLPKENILDLRFEKIFKIGGRGDRLGLFADITNVFNETVITAAQTRYPSVGVTTPSGQSATVLFGSPSSINAPRQIQLTARWSF